jgi:hypothetical protein
MLKISLQIQMCKACQYIMPSFLAAILIFGGCKSEKQSECINIDVATALKQTGKFPLSEMVSDVQVIQLDTVRDAFFGNMHSLSMTDHFFGFVCDQQKRAYLFDRSGKFIANIGRRGKYVIFRRPGTASPGFASILKYDLDFRPTLKILPRPCTEEETEAHYNYPTLMSTREGTCFWEAGRDTVYYIDRDGTASPRYHLDIKNHCFDQEKGQMKMHVPGQTDLCTKAISVVDMPGYLFVLIFEDGGSRTLIIDKESNTAFAPDRPNACDTASRENWIRTSIDNDVYGLEPLAFDQYIPERKELIALVRPGWAIETHDLTCIRQRSVKFPLIRDQLVTLTESRLGRESMAIVVMKLQ